MTVVIERPDAEQLTRAVAASRLTEAETSDPAYLAAPGSFVFIARDGDELCGWCWGHLIPRPEGGAYAYLHRLEVGEPFRRQGVARDLLRTFMHASLTAGATRMFLTTNAENRAVCALYDSLGGGHSDSGPTVNYWFALDRD